jgi:hypothetical protein
MANMLETPATYQVAARKAIISDLGDSKGSYISNQASDAGASYGMAGELRSRWLKQIWLK